MTTAPKVFGARAPRPALARAGALIAILLVGGALAAYAHEPAGRTADAPPDTATHPLPAIDVPREGDEEEGASEASHTHEAGAAYAGRDSAFAMPPLFEAMFDHLHNKLVHFPIVLGLLALVLFLLARTRPEMESVAQLLVWLAAVSAIATYFTGRLQEEAFHGRPKEWVVELHEKLGTATTLGLAGWAALITFARTRRFAIAWGIVIAIVLGATSFYGGLIAHGH